MNEAQIKNSPRLQRVMQTLADGQPHSTMEIITACQVCAVNSIVSELRRNGVAVNCYRDQGRWYYQLGK